MSEEVKIEVSAEMEGLISTIEQMSVINLTKLVSVLENRLGVSVAAPTAVVSAATPVAKEEVVEQAEFDVILKSVGASKINVIKIVRTATSIGLKEAKDLVEAAPKVIKEAVSKDDAEKLVKELTAAGADAELK